MRYVSLITFRDFVLALREDGRLYRIRFDFYTNQVGTSLISLPEAEEILRLPQDPL